mgnify:CR=1 FL=1
MMCFLKAFDKVAKCQKSAASSKIFVSLEALKSFWKRQKASASYDQTIVNLMRRKLESSSKCERLRDLFGKAT